MNWQDQILDKNKYEGELFPGLNKNKMKKKLIEIDAETFAKIEKLAKENDRSTNKQIVSILKKAVEKL